MKQTSVNRKIIRVEDGQAVEMDDQIVTEYPLTIKINGDEFVTMVCTPEYIEDMAVGYLASEGVIRRYNEIEDIWVQEDKGFIHIKTNNPNPLYQQFQNKRYVTSCCGMSRQGFVFVNDKRTAKVMKEQNVFLTPMECLRLMKDMQSQADMFKQTGGVHNAALCDKSGILLSRMDIGRHNALDKIYGYCLKNGIGMDGKIIAFSGRISSEILLKVAKIGCEIVLSKSAPTELALEQAEELGITTVGFIRGSSMNIYTHPERIIREGN
ncbi:formate dehydrogenase accessory sulfurtransferase FdhD [Falsibacillus pallidus]|uniref:formate dehydrogenase accessory sulfurtransferase FdhD n=1 Tax=Falsibacillus pallidus TaxID=493781 RepID=UPI003D962579